MSYRCSVPANTTATLYLPVTSGAVSGLGSVSGARCMGVCTHLGHPAVRYELVSGDWSFTLDDGRISVNPLSDAVR